MISVRQWIVTFSITASAAGCSWFTANRSDIGDLVCEVLPVFGRVCASPSALPAIRADAVALARELDAGPPLP